MRAAAAAVQTDPVELAYLEHRTAVDHGPPQIDGTQVTCIDGELGPRPLIDPERVDERRASVGPGPLPGYLDSSLDGICADGTPRRSGRTIGVRRYGATASYPRQAGGIIGSMHVGDRVVFLNDEPWLDLPEGTVAAVTDVRGSDAIEFQVADGRVFTTMESSLGPAPEQEQQPGADVEAAG